MSTRSKLQTEMEDRLALWGARFEALKARAWSGATAEMKSKLEAWHAAYSAATAKLAELVATTGDKWDLVKAELEKAWHAIENVLNEPEPATPQASSAQEPARARPAFTEEELREMTPEQQDAILEALVVSVVADGRTGQDEIARFNSEVTRVPWAQPKEVILAKAQAAHARVFGLKTDADRLALLKEIATRLPKGAIVEKTLAMMASVMSADNKFETAEKSTLGAFALAFGIPRDRLQAIGESLRQG